MFFWMLAPYLTYRWLLILAAVIPAIALLVKVYRSDRLERESPYLIGRLVISGIISTFFALVSEKLFGTLLSMVVPLDSKIYGILLYFGVVAVSEEVAKYVLLRKRTWNDFEFNCQFDGIVYATAVSLGFALWENISYVTMYGFSTAVVRAITAVPGHACFGIFMGIFYGLAKSNDYIGLDNKAKMYNVLSVLIPVLLHGTYDYIATISTDDLSWLFVAFVLVLFVVSYILVGRMAKNDKYMTRSYIIR